MGLEQTLWHGMRQFIDDTFPIWGALDIQNIVRRTGISDMSTKILAGRRLVEREPKAVNGL